MLFAVRCSFRCVPSRFNPPTLVGVGVSAHRTRSEARGGSDAAAELFRKSVTKRPSRRRLIDFAHAMDFGLVSSVLVVERPGSETDFLYVGNRPEDFASLSADKDISKKDPVLTPLRTHGLPFLYDQKFYVQAGAPELWERAAPYGYRTGISVALRLPGNKQFLLGLDRERPLPRSEQKITRMLGRSPAPCHPCPRRRATSPYSRAPEDTCANSHPA